MFDFIVKRRHMYFECDTKGELESHYLSRLRESSDESIGAENTEEFVAPTMQEFKRDSKILRARLRSNWKPKDKKDKPPKEEKHETTESAPITCPCEVLDKQEIQRTEE